MQGEKPATSEQQEQSEKITPQQQLKMLYSTPQLIIYGSVEEITKGPSAGSDDFITGCS